MARTPEPVPPKRLATFIDEARQQIVDESIKYAAELPTLSGQAIETLRDHLPLVLQAIARDLEQPQSRRESIVKSEGHGPKSEAETAAETHGVLRARSGLTIEQLVAEYRVLRSCVLRLWADAHEPDRSAIADTLRFNEAIDQAVAESVAYFSAEVERWRGIFLGVLGHDLRGPLNAMVLTAEVLSRAALHTEVADRAKAVLRNGRHMEALLNSLLDYSRSNLGVGMTVQRTRVNLAQLCKEEVEMLRGGLPDATILIDVGGDTNGHFDVSRVRQALGNLVFNAAQHGSHGTAINIVVTGHDRNVQVLVENEAEPISDETLQSLFEPLRRHSTPDESGSNRNLGLGLFIVREIARAHGGDAIVAMDGRRVGFRMTLPKTARAPTRPSSNQ